VIVFRTWWQGFVSDLGRVLLFLADDPEMPVHDMAARLDITERSAHGIVNDLIAAGYISKHEDGRHDPYQPVTHQPLPEPITREKTFREVLAMLPGATAGQPPAERDTAEPAASRRACVPDTSAIGQPVPP
jgi:hypothetical protein